MRECLMVVIEEGKYFFVHKEHLKENISCSIEQVMSANQFSVYLHAK